MKSPGTWWVSVALSLLIAVASAQTTPQVPADSTVVDSLYSRIISHVGTSGMREPGWRAERRRWLWNDARSLNHILERIEGLYLRTQGESGAFVGSSWFGGSTGDDGFMLDAVPVADPLTRRTNLSLVPLEYLEGFERLDPTDALLFGHRWNLVSRQYSNVRPVTAIRFTQEPNETILTDASFAQNIARSTNLSFGLQRHTTGGRYPNSRLDSWSLRGRIRANITEYLNAVATWSYERHTRGINGGVDRIQSPSIFNEITANVYRAVGYEIDERTDAGLGVIGHFLGDSLSPTRLWISSRKTEREYRKPDLVPALEERFISHGTDVRLAADQTLALPFITARAFGEIGSTHVLASQVFGDRRVRRNRLGISVSGTVSEYVIPRFVIGRSINDGHAANDMAASLDVVPGAGIRFAFGIEERSLVPTIQELHWTDSTVLRPTPLRYGSERLTSVSAVWSFETHAEFEVTGFRRQQTDAVLARPGLTSGGTPAVVLTPYSPSWSGVATHANVRIWMMELSGEFTYATVTVSDTIQQLLPQWWGTVEVAYQDRILKDQLGVRVGVRTRFSDRSQGLSPDPSTGFEVANTTVRIGRSATLDAYGTMQIGDAFLTLSWENLTDAPWLRTAVYPMPDRQFKLGVRWVFED